MKYKINVKVISIMSLALPLVLSAAEIENYVEISGFDASKNSAKFGEYTGLNDSNINGNLDIRGGNAYSDPEGVRLWEIKGNDLGTTSRSLSGTMSEQGKWKLKVGYDELRHNISDNYQTPQQGAMGGNTFTLPTTFGTINAYGGSATVASKDSARVLDATQLSLFHTEKVGTTRHNTSFGSNYIINDNLNLTFDYNHLEQTGAKLVGTGAQGGMNTPIQTGAGASDTWRAEAVFILMNPTKYKTDTFDLGLNWFNDKAHMTASYFGSIFKDGFNSVSWENNLTSNIGGATNKSGACASGTSCQYEYNSMSTAPNNSYHQLGLQGGYIFSHETRAVAGITYGINTQKDSYLSADLPEPGLGTVPTMQIGGLPANTLAGKIIQTHADFKVTNQSVDKLQLTAGYKYNKRDNRSPSKYYLYYNLGGVATSNKYTGINNPYSHYKSETELAADYRLTSAQKIHLAYETEKFKRWCNNAAHGLECVGSTGSFENKVKLDYKIKATDDLHFSAGYSYGKRTAEDVAHYMTPIGSEATIQASQMDGKDVLGFVSLPFAARNEHILKTGATWQFSEQLDFSLNGSYTKDNFESAVGVQRMNNEAANFDTSYAYNDNNIISAYLSYQYGIRDMHNANDGSTTVLPTKFWDNRLNDDSRSFGLVSKHTGLLGGNMEVIGDVSYSLDETKISTQIPYATTTPCTAVTDLSCGTLPTIKDSRLTLKLTDNYKINKNNKVSLGYMYEKRHVEDYYYNGYQYGYTPNRIMPSNEQAPSYNVSMVTVSYNYTF